MIVREKGRESEREISRERKRKIAKNNLQKSVRYIFEDLKPTTKRQFKDKNSIVGGWVEIS